MKKSTVSVGLTVCALLGLYASLAECATRQRKTAHPVLTTLHKRQTDVCSNETINELLQNYPAECIPTPGCQGQCFLSLLCSDSCAQSYYDLLVKCKPEYASSWELLCSKNEDGSLCIYALNDTLNNAEGVLLDACRTPPTTSCSVSCKKELVDNGNESGCCLYTFSVLVSGLQETDAIWAACNVDSPGVCPNMFKGGGEVRMTSYISILVLISTIASISLNWMYYLRAYVHACTD